jgi:hypothetical protein
MLFGPQAFGPKSHSYFSPVRTILFRNLVHLNFSPIWTIVVCSPEIRTSSIHTPVGESYMRVKMVIIAVKTV